MSVRVDEIADGIFRFSTFIPQIAEPDGFTFNQFLVTGDEPLLFHTGQKFLFPSVREAVAKVIDVADLRWITFGHYEADECGAMNDWLAVAPKAEVAHGAIGVDVSLNDQAARPPRVLGDGEVIDLGGKKVRHLDTPHVPHGWDAGLMFEETTGTLLCGDLFTQLGDRPALVFDDIVGPAIRAEEVFPYSTLTPTTGAVIRQVAELAPRTLGLMHGPSFQGDGAAVLGDLAAEYDRQIIAAVHDGFAAAA